MFYCSNNYVKISPSTLIMTIYIHTAEERFYRLQSSPIVETNDSEIQKLEYFDRIDPFHRNRISIYVVINKCIKKVGYLFVFFFKGEFLLFNNLQLVTEVEFGSLLLELGEFVLVFGHLL